MRNYTATVSWLSFKRSSYRLNYKTIKNIMHTDIVEAGKIALKTIEGKMCPALNSIWYEV